MSGDGQDVIVGEWQSLLVDQVEEEEISRMCFATYSRHVAMRRHGDALEFAHIWTSGNGALERGDRDEDLTVRVRVRRPARPLDKLDLLAAIVAGIGKSKPAVSTALRLLEDEHPR